MEPSRLSGKTRRVASWFQQWQAPVRRFLRARRSISDGDIDDVAQEVFLRLLRYESSELVTNPQGYLFTVAANVATEWSARACRKWPHSSDWLDEIATDDPAEAATAHEWADRQLQAVLNRLPARAREIMRLHYQEDLTHRKIAERLKISTRVVKRDLVASYLRMRADLDPDIVSEVSRMVASSPSRRAWP